jgi:hypothetical protein
MSTAKTRRGNIGTAYSPRADDISRRQFGFTGVALAASFGSPPDPLAGAHPLVRQLVHRVKSTRQSLGLSVAAAAQEAGITEHQWHGIENGTEQGALEVADASIALGVSVDWLIGMPPSDPA